MMLKGRHAACLQGAKASCALQPLASVPARRRPAAFTSASRSSRVSVRASAEPQEEPAAAPAAAAPRGRPTREVTVDLQQVVAGNTFTGKVSAVETYGAFVNFGAEKDGLVHISQLKDGYASNAADVVSVGQEVQVRVLSVDAANGKIALTMKAGAAAPPDEFDLDAAAVSESDEEGLDEGMEDDEDAGQLVYADEAAEFSFPFVVEADEGELSPEALLALSAQEQLDIEHETDLELPINELVTGKITKVDAFGAYIAVSHNGKEVQAYLDKEEAKVPSAALSAADLREFVGEGEAVPEYIDILGEDILYEDDEDEEVREETDARYEFDDLTAYYKVGDEVKAFVLGFDLKRDMMALTHFTDAEVQSGGLEALTDDLLAEEDSDAEDDQEGGRRGDRGDRDRRPRRGPRFGDDEEDNGEAEVPVSRLGGESEFDPLAFSPAELMELAGAEGEDGAGDDADADGDFDGEAAEAVGAYKVLSRGMLDLSSSRRGLKALDITFPERPSDGVDPFALQNVRRTEVDFDGDENVLDDMWQESGLEVSAAAWKKLNLKIQFDESGEAEVVPRDEAPIDDAEDAGADEGAAQDDEADLMVAASGDLDARVASWMELLLDDDVDEAEVAPLAYRAPLRK